MSNPELPTWPGASTVYARLSRINDHLCAEAYRVGAARRRRPRGRVAWTVPESVQENIDAMNRGDEEACKAGVQRHLSIALS